MMRLKFPSMKLALSFFLLKVEIYQLSHEREILRKENNMTGRIIITGISDAEKNVQMYLNVLRRWLVRKLLGDGLAVEVREKPSGYELQLIDLRRLIPYGFWKVEKNLRHKNLYNLIWLPASGQRKSTAESKSRSAQP